MAKEECYSQPKVDLQTEHVNYKYSGCRYIEKLKIILPACKNIIHYKRLKFVQTMKHMKETKNAHNLLWQAATRKGNVCIQLMGG